MSASDSSESLLGRVRLTRGQVDAFLSAAGPRKRRLLNLTIIGGTLAAALTAAPAVGGQSFTVWLTMTLGLSGPSDLIGYWLVGLHAAAALFHHYVMRDATMRRMLPGRAP